MKGNTEAKTPKQYMASLEGDRKADIAALDKLIRKLAPKLEPHIQSGMLGYGRYTYRYASGRTGEWVVIGLASQKRYISLYICAIKDGEYLAGQYADGLPTADIGKSCVRFKRLEDLDPKALSRLIKEAAKLGGMGAVQP